MCLLTCFDLDWLAQVVRGADGRLEGDDRPAGPVGRQEAAAALPAAHPLRLRPARQNGPDQLDPVGAALPAGRPAGRRRRRRRRRLRRPVRRR